MIMQRLPLQENELAAQPIIYTIRVPREYVWYGNLNIAPLPEIRQLRMKS
jgi:hypothetical protein